MPSVSVVIPCYRCRETVARAVASVAAQTQAVRELILVDDASDDGTREVLDELSAHGSAARLLRLPRNLGPGGARNAGWNLAAGDYIAFLDADDAWHPRKIELQLAWMHAHPAAVLCGHAIAGGAPAEPGPRCEAIRVTPAMLLRSNRFQTSSVMVRRGVNQRFAQDKRYCEDYLLWLEMVLAGGAAYYIDAALAVRFKPVYGSHGASGRLWRMQAGELDALARVRRAGLLGIAPFGAAAAWSCMKFLRRLALPAGNR